jgi:hypothetical protein
MDLFVRKHENKIKGTLSCFDRVLFRGYLPIQSGWTMAEFLTRNQISFRSLKSFLTENAEKIKRHSKTLAAAFGRPFQYLSVPTRKEDWARKMAEDEGIKRGLICVFSVLEPCRTFSFRFENNRPFVRTARRKCLFIYFYFMDRKFGLIHVKLQTWFPMQIQVYVNGHDGLERKLTANGISFTKHDNVLLQVDDWERAQKLADRFTRLNWPRMLERYARYVNPLSKKVIRKNRHVMEWVSMRNGVSYLFRYRDVSLKANCRYLKALAVVDDPTPALKKLDDVTTRKKSPSGRGIRAFNPLSRDDLQLFKAMMAGEHCIRGLSNADLRTLLESSSHLRDLSNDQRKQSSKVSRILSRFHTHKLIAKIPRTRRWKVTNRGKQIMAASLCLRNVAFPELFRKNMAT